MVGATLHGPRGDCDSPTLDMGLLVKGSVTVLGLIPGSVGDEGLGVPQWSDRGFVVVHLRSLTTAFAVCSDKIGIRGSFTQRRTLEPSRAKTNICVFQVSALKKLSMVKNICVFQVSALKKLSMVGRHNILFCQSILYRNCISQYTFPHFSANLTTFCTQFTIKCLGSGQKAR